MNGRVEATHLVWQHFWRSRGGDKLKEWLNYLAWIPGRSNKNILISSSSSSSLPLFCHGVSSSPHKKGRCLQSEWKPENKHDIIILIMGILGKICKEREAEVNKPYCKHWLMPEKQNQRQEAAKRLLRSDCAPNWLQNNFVWVIPWKQIKQTTWINELLQPLGGFGCSDAEMILNWGDCLGDCKVTICDLIRCVVEQRRCETLLEFSL